MPNPTDEGQGPFAVPSRIAEGRPQWKKTGSRKRFAKPDQEKKLPKVEIPDKLSSGVTVQALIKGQYQKKLLALFAPAVLPEMMNAVRRGLEGNDPAAVKIAAEMYSLLSGKTSGVNILVQQNNAQDNRVANVSAKIPGEFSRPDDIYRALAQERESRLLNPAKSVIELQPTPLYEKEPIRRDAE